MKRPPKYNPGFLDDREIRDLFCVRERELDILVRIVSGNTREINQHVMLIGPRGSGKTTLLRRLAAKIREELALDATWLPIVLMEENYEILSLRDLWKEALYHASCTPAATGSSLDDLWKSTPNTSEALNETLKSLKNPPGGAKNPYIKDVAFARLLELANREGKRLLLVCENVNDLFSQLSDQEAWELRGILQTEKRLMFIGSATAYFDEIEQPKQAFYNFFKMLELDRMNAEECAKLWLSVSGNTLLNNQSEALRILTGGLPRLLIILAWFGRDLSFLELMENLESLIDDHTDYFKGTMETLPPKERKVFASLARLWANSPVGMVATEAGMEQPETSAILSRLVGRGIVEEYTEEGETLPKRGKTYQLTERLFNIYYLMRRGGAEALFVHDVVHFLIQVFGADASALLDNLRTTDTQCVGERKTRYIASFVHSLEQICSTSASLSISHEDTDSAIPSKDLEALRKTVDSQRATKGSDHPDTLTSMSNLAYSLSELGRFEEAEALERETLELSRRVLGSDHPDTLTSMSNLAYSLSELGRFEEAKALYRETLELRRRVLGSDHPDTLTSMNNLAASLSELGRVEEAEALHRETLELRRRVLGSDHPDTLTSMYNLAASLSELGRVEEAEALNRETLELRRRVLGSDHPTTLTSMNNLAVSLSLLERFDEAEALNREALELCRRVLGSEHPTTLVCMSNLAVSLSALERFEEAEALDCETLELRRCVLGSDHPDTLTSLALFLTLSILNHKDEADFNSFEELLTHPAFIQQQTRVIINLVLGLASRSTEAAHQVVEMIEKSPSHNALYPLWAGIKLYLGEKMRLPREVREIAKLIRKSLNSNKSEAAQQFPNPRKAT